MTNITGDDAYRARRDFFNRHAAQWCDTWYKDIKTGRYDKHARDFERLFSILPLKAGDCVLDVGCGTGVLVPYILEVITEKGKLYELDCADRMLEVNKGLNRADNVRFILADAEDAPLDDGTCDAIICFSCFPHFYDMKKAMATLSRILKPGAVLTVSHFASSDELNRHHRSCHAVMHDHLPDKTAMYSLFQTAGLPIGLFIDEPGFYCITARKGPSFEGSDKPLSK